MMLSLAEAQSLLVEGVGPAAVATLPLAQCGGLVLAEDVAASRAQPPDPVSAMDGYAVRESDAMLGAELRIIGEAPAGAPFEGEVSEGSAVRIATGGVVPIGADRVVIQENVEREGEQIRIVEAPGQASFVRAAGSDFARGEILLRSGERLSPGRLALAAAANRSSLTVRRAPRVLILASGDELREPGSPLGKGDIVNSAGYAVEALARSWGARPERLPILSDDRATAWAQLAESALDADIIIPLGGASVGDRDALRPLFTDLGAELRFERVAVQPGKPTWHARFSDGRLVLGLPGNPASAFVCAWLFLKPLIERLSGSAAPALPFLHAIAAEDLPANGQREMFLRGQARIDAQARLVATAERHQDSHLQRPLARANALIRRRPDAPAAAPGEAIEILLVGAL